jgi:hypothetical protein
VRRILLIAAAASWLAAAGFGQSKEQPGLIREGVGVGGIRVGASTSDDVVKKFGKVYLWERNKKYSYQMTYPDKGLSFYLCQADKNEVIFLIEIKSPFKGMTGKGIVLGRSTKEETERIYGPPHDGFEYPGINFYYNRYGKRNVISEIDIVERSGLRQCDENK